MTTIIDDLQWRYAVKKFDPTKKLTQKQLNQLLEALRLAPSSFGIQPFKFLVIEDPQLRATIRTHAWNQSQITDASHLIALCALRTLTPEHIQAYTANIAATRNVPAESVQPYRDRMLQYVKEKSTEEVLEWSKRQTSIAFGVLLAAAAALHIDACPVEGMEAEKVDNDLDLAKDNLTIVSLCPVGFRAEDDGYAKLAKVRFAKEKIIVVK
ncbi:MAG: NAD(P)H-dependent oxidoreductase [Candidatus Peregrinibacteria bacterium]